jgi:hypothetical protein
MKASLATPLGEMWNREGPRRLYAETADHTQRAGGRNSLSTLDSQDSC